MRVQRDKSILFLVCLAPFLLMAWDTINADLGANPVESLTHRSGDWALRILLVTLAVSPLRQLSGWSRIVAYRRMVGLFAFFYAVLHFVVWIWLDQHFNWAEMLEDVVKRPYITVGFAAFILLIPLVLTSSSYAMRTLGRKWKTLHKSVYLIGVLAVLHYLWLVKADKLEPIIYGIVLILLLLFRTGIGAHLKGRLIKVE